MRQLKYIASIEMGQSPPSTEYSLQPEVGLPFLQGTADFGSVHPEPRVYCATPTKVAKSNDILFSVRAPVGELNIADQSYGIGRGLCAVTCGERLEQRFAWWALHWARSQLAFVATGSTYEAVAVSDVSNIFLPFPPLAIQRAIAAYLDRETAKIDAMIDAKTRLLALLDEKRRAMITHAVTRGLDSAVPLRDSGVPWIGKVPEHWEVSLLRYYLSNIEQGWSPQSDNFPADEEEWGVLKVGAVNKWEFDPNENKRLPYELEPLSEYEIKSGDILISRANTTELLGSAVLVEEVRSKLLLCDKIYRLYLREGHIYPKYLVAYLRSTVARFSFERDANGASSSMQNISQSAVADLEILVPPFAEQVHIADYIENERKRIDLLQHITQKSIELLHERRAALIAAAVTGKIHALE